MTQKTPHKTTILGIMSGTSLDGLDLALCQFEQEESEYTFSILKADTIAYHADLKEQLGLVKNAAAETYFALHSNYGRFIADEVNTFLKGAAIVPDAIASHGHTIFHQPALGFSTQIGCGATIAAKTGITTVCDFRSLDVAAGGQGAPLVPIGDQLLFGRYKACLNIGGIANISFNDASGNRVAYDICEANMLLNYLSEQLGHAFDRDGEIARSGTIDETLLAQLNNQQYYDLPGAKSIGREWFEKNILTLIASKKFEINNLLATATEHVAQTIANELNKKELKDVLISGGGSFNKLLVELIRSKTDCKIIEPNPLIVNFKEALIFAFLGYLRLSKKTNTLASVTGTTHNSIGGAVYLGRNK